MRPIAVRLAAVFLLSAALVSCRQSTEPAPSTAPRAVVRIGFLRLLSAVPLYTAVHEGYFGNENLDVQLRVIKSGPEGNEALAANNIDVAFSIVPSLIVAKARGVPSDLVSIYGSTVDGPEVRDHRIIVRKNGPIKTGADLRAKKVAVVGWPGPTSDVLELLGYLERHHLDKTQVTLVGMAHADMPAAVESGTVDAAAAAEPYVSLALATDKAEALREDEGFYYDPSVETEVTSYLARQSWLQANPDIARRFVSALDAGKVKAADREWLVSRGLPSFNLKSIPPIDFAEITSTEAGQLRFMPVKPTLSASGIQRVADQLRKFGFLASLPEDLPSLIWSNHR